MKSIKTLAILFVAAMLFLVSCSRSVTPEQAASNHYGHCRDMR